MVWVHSFQAGFAATEFSIVSKIWEGFEACLWWLWWFSNQHTYLGAGKCEDIVNLLSFIALNHCNWKGNLEINIFLSSEEDILKAMQRTEQTYHYYVLSHDITRISLGLEK